MKNELTYRRTVAGDHEQLKALGLSAYGKYAPLMSQENREKFIQSLSNEKTWQELFNYSTGFVCLDRNKIVGMTFLISGGNPWDIFKAEWAYIRMLGIDAAYEGRGIARTLINTCIAKAKEDGETILALHTSEMMEAARHIYDTSGFKLIKEIEPRFGKRYWIYTLNLENEEA